MSDEKDNDLLERLYKAIEDVAEATEVLEKGSCVRCGKGFGGGSRGSRCPSCLKWLRTSRATPGHSERAQHLAGLARKREYKGTETATAKSKGRSQSNKELVSKLQSAEKKTGERLSLDRKNNAEGYGSKNVRAVPEKLNRGRHTVNPKKLREWKNKIKKTDTPSKDELKDLILLKCLEKIESDE